MRVESVYLEFDLLTNDLINRIDKFEHKSIKNNRMRKSSFKINSRSLTFFKFSPLIGIIYNEFNEKYGLPEYSPECLLENCNAQSIISFYKKTFFM